MNQLCDSVGQQWCHTSSSPSVNYTSPFLAIWDQYTFNNTSARQMSSASSYPLLPDPVPGNPSSFFTNFPHHPCVASTIRIPQQTKSQDIPAVAPDNHQRKKETSSTPILKTTTAEGSISSTSTSSTGLFLHSSTPAEPPVRYLSDSLSFMATKAAFVEESQIPWSISAADIKRILGQSEFIRIPPMTELPQCVHIMMDVKTGKTLGVAFIECNIEKDRDIKSVLYDLSKAMPVQGRRIRFNPSSYDELLSHLFSEWPGAFHQGLATLSPNANDQQSIPFFIGQRDLQSLLNVCRNYKVSI
ncbi:hypothetical protein RMCBS344292_04633 [Rhizopus microsporus]|nr:hypothetical protein RMCBS344292_04633 [Rhizopus microsporus]